MNKYEIVKKIEEFAPLETQEQWDASGWLVDNDKTEVQRVLFALTVTPDIVKQAEENDCELIICHHPLFEVPLNYVKINIYCAHTNLDKADGGTTDLLIKKLGFEPKKYNDFVRVVDFDCPISTDSLKTKLKTIAPNLRYVNNSGIKSIKTIAFCAGSGSEFINEITCDAFVTGDLKFHTAADSSKVIFDIGHFESEIFVVQLLKDLSGIGANGIIAKESSPFKY